MSDWISVHDQIPEEDKLVLVFVKDGESGMPFKGWMETSNIQCGRWAYLKDGLYVTHWMPLPEPPAEE